MQPRHAQRSPWQVLQDAGRRLALARGDRRIHRQQRPLPRAPLQRVRELPALRAALPLRRWPHGPRGRRRQRAAIRRCACSAGGDVAAVRVVARGRATPPITLEVVHVDLYFFFDVDVVMLNVEVGADRPEPRAGAGGALPLRPRLPGRLGRAGRRRCTACASVEWLASRRQRCWRRRTRSSARPSCRTWPSTARRAWPRTGPALHAAAGAATIRKKPGALRFRQIEYYRMPRDGLSGPRRSAPAVAHRLHPAGARCTGAAEPAATRRRTACPMPRSRWRTSSSAIATTASGSMPAPRRTPATCAAATRWSWSATRHAEFFCCRDRGVLAQFRHQHFLLFLIAHFQKAALLMFSDRLVEALRSCDVDDVDQRQALQARDPRQLRGLPALHAPLLVPRDLGAGAGARAVPPVHHAPRRSTRSTTRSRSASPT